VTQLPAHLQNRQQSLITHAADGMGGLLPPHISIKDNRFTFVDGAGNRRTHEQITLDVIVADLSEHMNKRFYKYDYEPGADDPPTCWSANGVGPSIDAIEPQAPTCAACPNNVRGSATSNISGKAIKACRDEKWLAVVASPFPDMRWQFILTPGSFKNWAAYVKVLADRGVDPSWVVTRLGFERQGVLSFSLLENGWTPPVILDAIERERGSHAYDALVGRNDRPRQGALPAPKQTEPTYENPRPQQSFQPSPPPATGFGGAPNAGFPSTGQATAPTQGGQSAPGASPSNPPAAGEPQRRKRRTRAEMEAARAGQPAVGGQAPFPTGEPAQAAFGGAPPPAAAFGAAPPPAAAFGGTPPAAAANGGFGIQAGQEPSAELRQMLDNTFGKAP